MKHEHEVTAGGYVELHAHSSHSLLDGVAFPQDLVARAAAYGMPALAMTGPNATPISASAVIPASA